MWHKTEWKGCQMRLKLTRVGLLVYLANRYTTRGAHESVHITQQQRLIKHLYSFKQITSSSGTHRETHTEKHIYLYIFIFIRPPMAVEHSGEGIYGCRSHNAKLFERIEHSGIR